ncbi:MAG: 3-hydroxybutyryl-CoA dehydrogenase [Anaerolineae bacterium]|jgi:3-hydroxybutyryl-CoA dehydrogenase
MEVKNIGVVGCGLMGSGIVEACARAGYAVTVREINDEVLQKGLDRVKKSIGKGVARKKLTQADMDAALDRIQGSTDLADLAGSDLVIEAAVENMALKKEIFAQLDQLCAPGAILSSNTSSLCVTEMAAATGRPDKVLGLHFFNPVPVMPLLEIVRTFQTSEETLAVARALGESLGKTMVEAKDMPGFIVNRLLIPYLLDAVSMLQNGLASREDIDTAIKLGLNHPMGPLTLLDFVGLDTTLFIADAVYEELKDPRFAAPPLLRQLVLAGHIGRKAGRGFYDYR